MSGTSVEKFITYVLIKFLGGISLVGRALDSKSKGREFNSLISHQKSAWLAQLVRA